MLKNSITFIFIIFGTVSGLYSQTDSLLTNYANTINSDDLYKELKIIASKEFEGRETGKPGQKKAAQYIADNFKSNGLVAFNNEGYLQQFPAIVQNPFNVKFTVNGKNFELFKDFYFFPEFSDTTIHLDSILFVGYGINDSLYCDYSNKSICRNKVAIILSGEPIDKKKKSYLSKTEYMSAWTYNWKQKLTTAKAMGIQALLVADDEFDFKKDMIKQITKQKMILDIDDNNDINLPVFYISSQLANELLKNNRTYNKIKKARKKINSSGKSVSFITKSKIDIDVNIRGEKIQSENVIGYIEGSDLKDQILVISAHYDHLGKKDSVIYYGADDDGSGTSALLELAQAFSEAKKDGNGPRRSILFIAFAGEEKGLLGSKYYTRFPLFSLDSTVADLNIDMIGRIDTAHHGNPDYVYVIGSDKLSSDLHKINEEKNNTYTHLQLDYKYDDVNDPNHFYYRSDHYNFAKNNVPVIFYFNGVHADYHKPTDTIDKINFDKIEKISRLVFYTAWELANRDERIKVDSNKP